MPRLVQIGVSVVLLAGLLVFLADFREIWETLRTLDVRWALLGILILTADRLLMTYKWLLLLALRGHRMTILDATRLYCSAMVWGLALPSTVGADAIRTVLLKRRGIGVADALGSIVIERAMGFLVAIALALVSLAVLHEIWPDAQRHGHWLFIGAAALIGGGLLLVFSFSHRAFGLMQGLMPASWRGSRIVTRLEQLHDAYRSLGSRYSTLMMFTCLTLVEQLIAIPFTWSVARSLGIEVSLVTLLATMPLAMILSRLPASFDGFGVFEGVLVVVMGQAGVTPAQALAIAAASRLLNLLALLPWSMAHGVGSGELRRLTSR